MSASSTTVASLRRPLIRTPSTPPLTDRRKAKLAPKVAEATQVIQQALDQYGLDKLSLSFNGGKDCTVLLHLLHSLLPPPAPSTSTDSTSSPPPPAISISAEGSSASARTRPPIKAIYITAPAPFPSVEAFVDDCAEHYGLDLVRIGGGMKDALSVYLTPGSSGEGIEGVLVGTRRGDPHGAELSLFQKTDPSWPQFMRIHPILNWSYTDIWDYLRLHEVPWCDLYDEGFTSLGSQLNTHPNPALALSPPAPEGTFGPAWTLEDEALERAGRGDPPAKVLAKEGVLPDDEARKALEEDDTGDRS